MSVELATAYVQLVPSATGIKSKIAQELNLDQVARQAGAQAGASLGKTLITGATAAFAGFAIGRFLRGAFDEASEAQKVGAQTAAVLKSTGEAAHVSADAVGELAGALSKKAGIDDEVIQSGENVLLTFTNIRNEAGKGNDIFDRTTKAAVDLSVAMGQDLQSSVVQLGKALNDPIKGMTALQRVGVTFSESQKETIKSLVETGDLLGAQKVILREVTKEFGGSAAAQATAADKAKVAIGNLKESVGVALMPAFTGAAKAVSFFTDALNSLPGPIRTAVIDAGLLGGGLLAALAVSSKFGAAFSLLASGAALAGEAVAGLTSVIRGFTAAELLAAAAPVAFFAGIAVAATAAALAIDKFAGGSEGGLGKFIDAAVRGKQAGSELSQSIISASSASITPIKVLQTQYDALQQKIRNVKQSFDEGNLSTNEAVQASSRLKAAAKDVAAEIDREKQAQTAADNARRQAIQGVNAYAFALQGGATETQALAAAGDKGREAIQNLQNVLLAAAGGALGYAQSQANLVKAQDDYNTAVATFGPASAEAQAAALNLQSAQLGNLDAAQKADQAQQALVASLKDGQPAYDAQIAALQRQIVLHPENAAAIQLEIDKLNAAAIAANTIPGAKTITVTADTGDAYTKLAAVKAQIDGILASPFVTLSGSFIVGAGHASGGSVFAGQGGLVGERGPELFIPAVDGRILSHADSMRALSSASTPTAGGRSGITFTGPVVFGSEDAVRDLDYFSKTKMAGV